LGITPEEMKDREIIDKLREENQVFSDIFDEVSLVYDNAYEWCYDAIIEGFERKFGKKET